MTEKKREYMKKYYETHKEEMKEKSKKYNETHKEQIKKQKKKWRETHKEYMKKWCETHKENINRYNETHKENYKKIYKKHQEKFKKYQRYFHRNYSRFITLQNYITIMKLGDDSLKLSIMIKLGKGIIDQDEAVMLSGMTFTKDDLNEMNEWFYVCKHKSSFS